MKTVMIQQLVEKFKLEVLTGENRLNRTISNTRVHRPGLEFAGYYEFFPQERIQVLGLKEIGYLHTLTEEERDARIKNVVKYHPPCFVVTRDQEGLTYLIDHCRREDIPLLRTSMTTSKFIGLVDSYVTKMLAPEIQVHGVCMNVAGIGILLRGKSGIGKSETALTLIRRGHRLVSDDAVVLRKMNPETLIGSHDGKTREFLALRSIGLINVARIYGRSAFQEETRIVLDIELTKWKDNELNNELELEPRFTEYMDVKVPTVQIQLQPGRDVASLVEAAANNYYLQQQGYSAAEEFISRLNM
ncbi:HPr(Ser) kinase/phosphatase [Paenibacillus thiaminolyticus]|uniref:HPr kinase/phosphorylase n=1 Tax=Paenibacillus thiaminolyticus TaxID=49283 RepID=A0A378XC80_PANTH|nr:HPr(Ser) kinase/phosphatase [Paenibacillus thiaminolyticus]MCY9534234.1 HPr(Ser) kinase/phosphatase [Paenibacillus thiaminolyticus]MCY9605552.1 HPr(Ser) kinase/phosphatase [Paenibacillus thiaminolyticus]MCY9608176.1 HPr(Ser) kinase/phosphatase [Paenibacillus thiaminolyticus]MCY9615387.1 HPr(Ser) kinase/phosphatase [Paenibacillus thiaminolyticus]MCY9618328.1 HPr(Ser) kinase/phosphatase [Paenibacillus thiaminolyticus]